MRIGVEAYAGGDGLTDGGLYAFAIFGFPELEGVGDGAISDLGGSLYAWPAYALIAGGEVYGKPEGTQELVLADFHPTIEIGEVHDAGEIGFGELYGTGHGKFGWHGK